MLGNLFDYNPKTDALPYESMLELDKFALHKLQGLVAKTIKAYDAYEYHTIYHSLHNYCTLDLSSFYLDILKDRLYTSPPKSAARRSAQTVMHIVLDTLVKLMAPLLPFTAEEIWEHMPAQDHHSPSVHLTQLPKPNPEFEDNDLAQKWEQVLVVRGEVTKALEEARNQKLVGHPLDAAVTIAAQETLYTTMLPHADDLRYIFIVSETRLLKDQELEGAFISQEVEGLSIRVEKASGEKCERCWVHDTSVGSNSEHPTICNRCKDSLAKMA
jgi:isoleucyl-tRNA synthetase